MIHRALPLLFCALSTPALADGVLPLARAFGNAAGCAFYNTGAPPVGDDYLLLTPDSFASHDIACDFAALASSGGGAFTIKALCQAAGQGTTAPDHLQVVDHAADGYGIKFDGIDEIGPLKACLPAGSDGSSEVQL